MLREKLGFVGLGIMGAGMAHNLLKAGHEVCVWNRATSKMDAVVNAGAIACESPADVARQSDIIFVCVGASADVHTVILGDDGIIHGVQADSLVVDHSTISPKVTREIGNALSAYNVQMLDAPISGGSEGAKLGTLAIMVGGEASQVERALPYMQAMGKTITHVGELGMGQMVKLVNQILVVTTMQGIAEALVFAQKAGLDLDKTLAAVSGGAAGSWALTNRGPQMVARDWRPGFTVDWQTKDVRLIMEAADELGVALPTTSLIYQLYRALQATGHGAEGNHSIVKMVERLAGVQVGTV